MAGNICSKSGGFHETINHEVIIAENELRIYAECDNCDKDLVSIIPFKHLISRAIRKDYDMRVMTKEELLEEIKNMENYRNEYGFKSDITKQLWEMIYIDHIEKKEDPTKRDMMAMLSFEKGDREIFVDKTSISDEEMELADKCSHIPHHAYDPDCYEEEAFESNCKNCEYIIRYIWSSCSEGDFFDVLDQSHL